MVESETPDEKYQFPQVATYRTNERYESVIEENLSCAGSVYRSKGHYVRSAIMVLDLLRRRMGERGIESLNEAIKDFALEAERKH